MIISTGRARTATNLCAGRFARQLPGTVELGPPCPHQGTCVIAFSGSYADTETMIVYDLHCGSGHQFEGWFDHADDYAAQKGNGLLMCPVCSSAEVVKLPTASHVHTLLPKAEQQEEPSLASSPKLRQTKMLQALRQYVGENFADVGCAFPEEARRMHYGEAEPRNIHGVASHDEFTALRDEGVEVYALPPLMDKRKLN
jgi:hypothetical protein